MLPDGKVLMMKMITNLITYRKRFPFICPFEENDDVAGCLLQVSRTLRPAGVDDYITINIDDLMDIYLSIEETRIWAAELNRVADYKGNE
jgi:hypothetical protein